MFSVDYDPGHRFTASLISLDTWLANLEKFELENRKLFRSIWLFFLFTGQFSIRTLFTSRAAKRVRTSRDWFWLTSDWIKNWREVTTTPTDIQLVLMTKRYLQNSEITRHA